MVFLGFLPREKYSVTNAFSVSSLRFSQFCILAMCLFYVETREKREKYFGLHILRYRLKTQPVYYAPPYLVVDVAFAVHASEHIYIGYELF